MEKGRIRNKTFDIGSVENGYLEDFLNSDEVEEIISILSLINSRKITVNKTIPDEQSPMLYATKEVYDQVMVNYSEILVVYREPYRT